MKGNNKDKWCKTLTKDCTAPHLLLVLRCSYHFDMLHGTPYKKMQTGRGKLEAQLKRLLSRLCWQVSSVPQHHSELVQFTH